MLLLQYMLMMGRSVDVLLLCSLYAVCKIRGPAEELRFRQIIAVHTNMPWAKLKEFMGSDVLLNTDDSSPKYGTIVDFYNTSFISEMKTFLLGMGPTTEKNKNTPGDSIYLTPKPTAKLVAARLLAGSTPFSPRTRRLYSAPESPLAVRQDTGSPPMSSTDAPSALGALKRLDFREDLGTEDGPPAKRARSSLVERRLTSMR
eukprot:m.253975 g.253975  ORF g.253975 m.253975 type:complete len:202 (+) comp16166_c0_seq28:1104-1709(+)